jgi:Activator of Hsp90 ATPase homolog 1-like protein
MTTLRHAIKVEAPRDAAYHAFADIAELAGWHMGSVQGEVHVGKTFTIERRPGLRFGWRTDELDPGLKIVQTCTEGPGTSAGRTLTLAFSSADDDRTLVELSDAGWRDDDPDLPLCNTYWGEALGRLRSYLQSSKR